MSQNPLKKAYEPTVRFALRNFSELGRLSLGRQPTWKNLEYIYRNRTDGVRSTLDKLFLQSRGSKASRSRLNFVKEKFKGLIRDYSCQGTIYAIDVGTGSGRYVVDTLQEFPECDVCVTCLDQDPEALEYANGLIKNEAVRNKIEFRKGNAFKRKDYSDDQNRQFDIALSVGILDYLSHERAVALLSSIYDCLRDGGTALTSNMRRHNLSWVMDAAGWKLVYKDAHEMEDIMKEAGFADVNVQYEPLKLFAIAVGKKKQPISSA